MERVLNTVHAVIDALGGNAEVARLTRRGHTAVSNWRCLRTTFPPDTYVVMTAALQLSGYTAPASLWQMVGPESASTANPNRRRRNGEAEAAVRQQHDQR